MILAHAVRHRALDCVKTAGRRRSALRYARPSRSGARAASYDPGLVLSTTWFGAARHRAVHTCLMLGVAVARAIATRSSMAASLWFARSATGGSLHAPSPPITVSVEGSIGAGKSSLLRLLRDSFEARDLHVETIPEPVDMWKSVGGSQHNLLEHFYKDPRRWAYLFQSYAFMTRLQSQCAPASTAPVRLVERSVFSDRHVFAQNAFDTGLMEPIEWQCYLDLWQFYTAQAHSRLDAIIFLDVTTAVCHKRMARRARDEEALVPLAYLEQLRAKHDAWLPRTGSASLDGIPLLRLQTDGDFETDASLRERLVDDVTQFIDAVGRAKAAAASAAAS